MATFISPAGNPEIWGKKPEGYMTPEEWQIAHPAPEPTPPTPEEQAQERKNELLAALARLDAASARSLRAIIAAQTEGNPPDAADVERLRAIEAEAQTWRLELARLQ